VGRPISGQLGLAVQVNKRACSRSCSACTFAEYWKSREKLEESILYSFIAAKVIRIVSTQPAMACSKNPAN
jgi:hypothetical protein